MITANPTCCAVGTKTFTCAHNSEHTKTEDVAINENAHTLNADDGDCTTDITCSVCGEVITAGKDTHEYGEVWVDETVHTDEDGDHLCDGCGIELPRDGLGTGAIVGIALGSVAVVGLGGFSLAWFGIKKKTRADLVRIFKK